MKLLVNHLMACLFCTFPCCFSLGAQTYIRYVNPQDLDSRIVYSDSVLTSIQLPVNVAKLSDYPPVNAAAQELAKVLEDPDKLLLQVWICGSSSPDGLFGENTSLARERTGEAAAYIREIMDIPESMIHAESLDEDWNRLAELIAESDMPYRDEILRIISEEEWGARKEALRSLDNGRAWEILNNDFFPLLRCVRFAIFCKWDSSKPYLTAPEPEYCIECTVPGNAPAVRMKPAKDTAYIHDTVYVNNTLHVITEPEPDCTADTAGDMSNAGRDRMPVRQRERKYWDTPWMMGIKTNVLADAVVLPDIAVEIQLAEHFSFELMGTYTRKNIFYPDRNTNVYGISPEVRYWMNDAMHKGHFFGVHANLLWYTTRWSGGLLYQNFGMDPEKAGNERPAWSVGATYGYNLRLDRKDHWGIEFLLGIGYGQYRQQIAEWSDEHQKWFAKGAPEDKSYIGVTKVGINLCYRFSVRRVRRAE
ncbi:MAG: DUF3575 domain-containing protein [Clostridium sp.]|nr:DUF3575 domain-containing protein [Bacteroides sp.]MCM1198425.1 DUF3575 domain-containing protein [Clostridium sp.]